MCARRSTEPFGPSPPVWLWGAGACSGGATSAHRIPRGSHGLRKDGHAQLEKCITAPSSLLFVGVFAPDGHSGVVVTEAELRYPAKPFARENGILAVVQEVRAELIRMGRRQSSPSGRSVSMRTGRAASGSSARRTSGTRTSSVSCSSCSAHGCQGPDHGGRPGGQGKRGRGALTGATRCCRERSASGLRVLIKVVDVVRSGLCTCVFPLASGCVLVSVYS